MVASFHGSFPTGKTVIIMWKWDFGSWELQIHVAFFSAAGLLIFPVGIVARLLLFRVILELGRGSWEKEVKMPHSSLSL